MKMFISGIIKFPDIINLLSEDINKYLDIDLKESDKDDYLCTKFKDNPRYYFRRFSWANNYYIKLSLCTEKFLPVSDDIYEKDNYYIIKKIQNKELQLGLSLVHCIGDEYNIEEKDTIISNHCINNSDLFADDWYGYLVDLK